MPNLFPPAPTNHPWVRGWLLEMNSCYAGFLKNPTIHLPLSPFTLKPLPPKLPLLSLEHKQAIPKSFLVIDPLEYNVKSTNYGIIIQRVWEYDVKQR